MTWLLNITGKASKKLKKLDVHLQNLLVSFLEELSELKDPMSKGKALTGNLTGLWRYRVGDFRIVCEIKKEVITILVLDLGHRKEIYKTK